MTPPRYHENLQNSRTILKDNAVDGFVLSVNDEFFSEYPPEHFKRLEWLTGFTGSAGTIVLAGENTAFFTDGRYTLQAANELAELQAECGLVIFNSSEKSPLAWLEEQAAEAAQTGKNAPVIGFDPWLVSQAQHQRWQAQAPSINWQPLDKNPIDTLWQEGRPALAKTAAFDYPLEVAGQSREEKIAQISAQVKQAGAAAFLLCAPESICWLLNIRGRDMDFTPLLLSRALVLSNGRVELFAENEKIPANLRTAMAELVVFSDPEAITDRCAALGKAVETVLMAAATTPVILADLLGEAAQAATDPCTLPKACKNPTEVQHIAETHITDGKALSAFLAWLNEQKNGTVSELAASDKLEEFRQKSPAFVEPSFPTIAGFGANGAIVHYRVTESSDQMLKGDNLFLVDSGGQYLAGTTDVTRTVAIGTPTEAMRVNFTRVLQGHIALSNAVFPQGITGSQLDILARKPLWEAGLDYDHGTGHGVGCFMGVHEGPQGISKRPNNVALQRGMILSNEPGYYENGEYGIRIENLVVVAAYGDDHPAAKVGFSLYDTQALPQKVEKLEKAAESSLYFRTLTCAPMDERLVVWEMLSDIEKSWWDAYHAWVAAQL